MTVKKVLLFASAALAIMAFAAPALANAEKLYDAKTESEIHQHIEFNVNGTDKFRFNGNNGFDCKVEMVYTTEGAVNRISSYKITSCTGVGIFSTCKVKSTEITGIPWTVDLKGGKIIITDKTIDLNLEKCLATFFKVYFKEEVMTPDKLKGFGLMTASEAEDTTEDGETGTGHTTSEFEVQGEAKGTYGIEE